MILAWQLLFHRQEIRAKGSKASRMNGYHIGDAMKLILGMDSVPGIKLKEQLFGPIGIFAKPDTSHEIHWESRLGETFEGFELYHNYRIGPYLADFFISSSKVVLECNGYEHRYYDAEKEREREKFITQEYGLVRFDSIEPIKNTANVKWVKEYFSHFIGWTLFKMSRGLNIYGYLTQKR